MRHKQEKVVIEGPETEGDVFSHAPAADAGPRQPCPHVNTMGHEWESHCVDCGKRWKHGFTPYTVSLAAPPVPQEAAPRCLICDQPMSPKSACALGHCPLLTAPDSAMRVARDIKSMLVRWIDYEDTQCVDPVPIAALIREAGSERERELRRSIERADHLIAVLVSFVKCGEIVDLQANHDISSWRAEASRLLGGESK